MLEFKSGPSVSLCCIDQSCAFQAITTLCLKPLCNSCCIATEVIWLDIKALEHNGNYFPKTLKMPLSQFHKNVASSVLEKPDPFIVLLL